MSATSPREWPTYADPTFPEFPAFPLKTQLQDVIETGFASGLISGRSRTTAGYQASTHVFILRSEAHRAAFHTFWKTTLKQGGLDFKAKDPMTNVEYDFNFSNPQPSITESNKGVFHVTVNVRTLALP